MSDLKESIKNCYDAVQKLKEILDINDLEKEDIAKLFAVMNELYVKGKQHGRKECIDYLSAFTC